MQRMFYFISIFILVLINTTMTDGQVSVTAANNGQDLTATGNPSGWATLNTILITENSNPDIPTSQVSVTLILTAPSNWRFNTGVGSASNTTTDPDVTIEGINVQASTITVTFSSDTPANRRDVINIIGIQVQPINPAITPSLGNIYRTFGNPGTASITGITNDTGVDDGTNFGTLSLDLSDPLPVDLTSFSASFTKSGVILNWRTVTEVNNYGFEVQRCSKIEKWDFVGFVEGHGNSYSPKEYEFIDDLSFFPDYSMYDSLKYRLKQIDLDGRFEYYYLTNAVDLRSITNIKDDLFPEKFELYQNYPNPFNPATTIKYTIPEVRTRNSELRTPNSELRTQEQMTVTLRIYDILGREIATLVNTEQHPGKYEVNWDASGQPAGVYLYKLSAGSFKQTKKMLLLK